MMDPIPLALVTGAGHRLGKQIALALAHAGFAIGLHYHHSRQEAEQTAQELLGVGAMAYLLQADLTRSEEIERMFAEIDNLPHQLGLLVNSAAVMPSASLMDLDVDAWDGTIDLNLRAPFLCAQSAARRMGEAGGLVVNITDSGAHKAWTRFPAYTVSKAGLESLTRLLARALGPAIRVNAVAPGLILPSENVSPQEWERLVSRLPLRRAGTPEDVAQTIIFLWQNTYITGQTIVVDGGYELI